MQSDSINYFAKAGIDFKSAESPDLWAHLEDCFADHNHIGPRFNPIPSSSMMELITKGEQELFEALAAAHRHTGKLQPVAHVVEMPYVVGTEGKILRKDVDPARTLQLVNRPGTMQEHRITVLPTKADAIPCTNKVTITGGLYADGHTVGIYGVHPGTYADGMQSYDPYVLLATPQDIEALAREMEAEIEAIAAATRQECDAMLARVRALLK